MTKADWARLLSVFASLIESRRHDRTVVPCAPTGVAREGDRACGRPRPAARFARRRTCPRPFFRWATAARSSTSCSRTSQLASVEEVVIVTGFAAERVEELLPALEERHGLRIESVHNDKAEEWNNAHSLWLAREAFAEGALLLNGDTVHPPSVEGTLLAARSGGVILAVDDVRARVRRR